MNETNFRVYDEKGCILKGHRDFGRVVPDIHRVSPELIESIAKYGVAKVAELQGYGGVMHKRIRPIKTGFHMAGPAFTAWTPPGAMLYPVKACYMCKAGDILVFGGGTQDNLISFGDGIGGQMKQKGVGGIVMDNAVHDVEALRKIDLPLFCTGGATYLGNSYAPGAINIPIACGDVVVYPGDIVIGDDDGIVVVPWQDAERIAAIAEAQYPIDVERRRAARDGTTLIELNHMEPLYEKWEKFQSAVHGT